MRESEKYRSRPAKVWAAGAVLLGMAGSAGAFNIPTGDDDIKMRIDNTISFTAGMRVRDRDGINSNPAYSADVASDYVANSGDFYKTRFDLFSEFDFVWKNDTGIRLSGGVWYDPSFPSGPKLSPAVHGYSPWGAGVASPKWSDFTKFYNYAGAELIDGFGFTRFDLASVPTSLKLGQTAEVWGESQFGQVGGINSIGYAQNPNDGRKSSQNPNASLKETVIPLPQAYAVFQFADNLALSAYGTFEWRPDRIPDSGTYMGVSDGIYGAPNLFCANTGSPTFTNFCLPYVDPVKGKAGDWGLQFKARPEWLDGTVSLNYRKFDEKAPWYAVWDPSAGPVLFGGFFPVGAARSVYGRRTEMFGLTANLTRWKISWAGEINYRRHGALLSDFSALATPGAGGRNTTVSPTDGPRGDTLHALANMQWITGKALFWDTFTFVAEGGFSHLVSVSDNAQYFQGIGPGYAPVVCNLPAGFPGASGDKRVADCADRNAGSFGVYVDPTTYQVFPSIDLDIPVFASMGFGNDPDNGGTADRNITLSAGLKFTVATKRSPHIFQINYLAFRNRATTVNTIGHNILGAPYYDRDQVQFSYTTTF